MKRLFLLALSLSPLAVLAGCAGSTTTGPGGSGEKLYDLKGQVRSIDVDEKKVQIAHEDIPGKMKAMTMFFHVEDVKLLEGLKPGDTVVGKMKEVSGKYYLTELKVEAPAVVDEEAAIKKNLAKLSPEDRKLAEEQQFCPDTDARLGASSMGVPLKVTLKGEPVFICCQGCQKNIEEDPDATLKKVAEFKKKK